MAGEYAIPLGMIVEALAPRHLPQAAWVYAMGLGLETPPGDTRALPVVAEREAGRLASIATGAAAERMLVARVGNGIRGVLEYREDRDSPAPRVSSPPQSPAPSPRWGGGVFMRFLCAVPVGQGTGTELLVGLAERQLAHGRVSIECLVSAEDERSRAFYFARHGFTEVSRFRSPSGLTLIRARADLMHIHAHARKR